MLAGMLFLAAGFACGVVFRLGAFAIGVAALIAGYALLLGMANTSWKVLAIELLLAHSAGYVELFYGRPLNQSSWELATDALARTKSGMLVGGAKRLYGIVEGGDLAYVEERVDADGGLVPHLSARLTRFVG